MATNGVAHVVTSRLPEASRSIYEIVANDPSFSTLKTGTQYSHTHNICNRNCLLKRTHGQ